MTGPLDQSTSTQAEVTLKTITAAERRLLYLLPFKACFYKGQKIANPVGNVIN